MPFIDVFLEDPYLRIGTNPLFLLGPRTQKALEAPERPFFMDVGQVGWDLCTFA